MSHTETHIKDPRNFDNDYWAVHKIIERGSVILAAIVYAVIAILAAVTGIATVEVLTITAYVFFGTIAVYILGVRAIQTVAESVLKSKLGVEVDLDGKDNKNV
jgi:hypothetical protein